MSVLTGTSDITLERLNSKLRDLIPRPACSCRVTLSGSFQWCEPQLLPLERMGDVLSVRSRKGYPEKNQWDNGLARTWCSPGNHKASNVRDSSFCLVFIRLVLGHGQSGEYVWKAKAQTCADTHMKPFSMKLEPELLWFSVGLEERKDKLHCNH